MHAPKMHELSAPTDEFLADLERFSVPFGLEINGRWISTPPEAWERVFNGPHGPDGKPLRFGGLTAPVVKAMRERAALPAEPPAVEKQHTAGMRTLFPDQRYSAAVTAPPAPEPAADAREQLTAPQAPTTKAHP